MLTDEEVWLRIYCAVLQSDRTEDIQDNRTWDQQYAKPLRNQRGLPQCAEVADSGLKQFRERFPRLGSICTRAVGHPTPCNGFPRLDCPHTFESPGGIDYCRLCGGPKNAHKKS